MLPFLCGACHIPIPPPPRWRFPRFCRRWQARRTPGWTSQVEAGVRAPGSLQVSRAGSDGHTRPPSSQLLLWAGSPALGSAPGLLRLQDPSQTRPAVSQACGDQRWLRPRAGEGRHAGGEPASQGRHTLPFGVRPGPFVHGHGESFQWRAGSVCQQAPLKVRFPRY